jgi:uncharacterized membrane protein YgaE (UPF0421/DUF939 family)
VNSISKDKYFQECTRQVDIINTSINKVNSAIRSLKKQCKSANEDERKTAEWYIPILRKRLASLRRTMVDLKEQEMDMKMNE